MTRATLGRMVRRFGGIDWRLNEALTARFGRDEVARLDSERKTLAGETVLGILLARSGRATVSDVVADLRDAGWTVGKPVEVEHELRALGFTLTRGGLDARGRMRDCYSATFVTL